MKRNSTPSRVPWYRRTTTLILGLAVGLLIVIGATHKSPPATANINAGGAGSSTATASPSPTAAATTPDAVPAVVITSAAPPTSAAPAVVTPAAPATTTTHAAPPPPRSPAPVHTTRAPAPTVHTTKAAPSTCGAPANPYGYTLCDVGGLVTSPTPGVCTYFNCIANFVNGTGYMVECNDGTYSMSGGKRGACSYHNGEGPAVHVE